MIRWKTSDPIGSQSRLVQLLRHLEAQALREGLRFEVASAQVRREAAARARRDLQEAARG